MFKKILFGILSTGFLISSANAALTVSYSPPLSVKSVEYFKIMDSGVDVTSNYKIQSAAPDPTSGIPLTVRPSLFRANTSGSYIITFVNINDNSTFTDTVVITATPTYVQLSSGAGQSATTGTALAQPIQVLVSDSFANPVSGVTVTWAITGAGGTFSPSVTNSSGIASTTLTMGSVPGTYSVTATAGSISTGELIQETASPAANQLTNLLFQTQPASIAQRGITFPAQPVLFLSNGSSAAYTTPTTVTVSAFNNSVCSSPAIGTLSGTLSVQSNALGVATFTNLAYSTNDVIFLKFSAGSLSACSNLMNIVSPTASATKLTLNFTPTSAYAGTQFNLFVNVSDVSGNIVGSAINQISLAAFSDATCQTPVTGSLTGNIPINSYQGQAMFNSLVYSNSGVIYLQASSPTLTSSCSTPILINSNPINTPTKLAFYSNPASEFAGQTFSSQPFTTIQNRLSSIYQGSPNYQLTIAAYSDSSCQTAASGVLSGTTSIQSNFGAGAFGGLNYSIAGSIYLGLSAPGLTSACSSLITINPVPLGSAAKLKFTVQPSTSSSPNSFIPIQPSVEVEDSSGTIVTTSLGFISLNWYSDLTCSTPATGASEALARVVNGASMFSNAGIATSGTYYLKASMSSLTTACSNGIVIGAISIAPPTAILATTVMTNQSIDVLTIQSCNSSTSFLVSNSSLAPSISDSRWAPCSALATQPQTLTTQGFNLFYVWGKDNSGNLSASSTSVVANFCSPTFDFISGSCYTACSASQHHNITTQACESNSLDCSASIINSLSATRTWSQASGYGICNLISCNSGFDPIGLTCLASCLSTEHRVGTSCVSNTQNCPILNGVGSQIFAANTWGSCQVDSCSTGFAVNSVANTCDSTGPAPFYSRIFDSTGKLSTESNSGNITYGPDYVQIPNDPNVNYMNLYIGPVLPTKVAGTNIKYKIYLKSDFNGRLDFSYDSFITRKSMQVGTYSAAAPIQITIPLTENMQNNNYLSIGFWGVSSSDVAKISKIELTVDSPLTYTPVIGSPYSFSAADLPPPALNSVTKSSSTSFQLSWSPYVVPSNYQGTLTIRIFKGTSPTVLTEVYTDLSGYNPSFGGNTYNDQSMSPSSTGIIYYVLVAQVSVQNLINATSTTNYYSAPSNVFACDQTPVLIAPTITLSSSVGPAISWPSAQLDGTQINSYVIYRGTTSANMIAVGNVYSGPSPSTYSDLANPPTTRVFYAVKSRTLYGPDYVYSPYSNIIDFTPSTTAPATTVATLTRSFSSPSSFLPLESTNASLSSNPGTGTTDLYMSTYSGMSIYQRKMYDQSSLLSYSGSTKVRIYYSNYFSTSGNLAVKWSSSASLPLTVNAIGMSASGFVDVVLNKAATDDTLTFEFSGMSSSVNISKYEVYTTTGSASAAALSTITWASSIFPIGESSTGFLSSSLTPGQYNLFFNSGNFYSKNISDPAFTSATGTVKVRIYLAQNSPLGSFGDSFTVSFGGLSGSGTLTNSSGTIPSNSFIDILLVPKSSGNNTMSLSYHSSSPSGYVIISSIQIFSN